MTEFVFCKKLYNPLAVIYVRPQINVLRFFSDVKCCMPLSVTFVVSIYTLEINVPKLRKTKFGSDAIEGSMSSLSQ